MDKSGEKPDDSDQEGDITSECSTPPESTTTVTKNDLQQVCRYKTFSTIDLPRTDGKYDGKCYRIEKKVASIKI